MVVSTECFAGESGLLFLSALVQLGFLGTNGLFFTKIETEVALGALGTEL